MKLRYSLNAHKRAEEDRHKLMRANRHGFYIDRHWILYVLFQKRTQWSYGESLLDLSAWTTRGLTSSDDNKSAELTPSISLFTSFTVMSSSTPSKISNLFLLAQVARSRASVRTISHCLQWRKCARRSRAGERRKHSRSEGLRDLSRRSKAQRATNARQ